MQSCDCIRKRYKIPLPRKVPVALRNLTEAEIRALRPLEISSSKYERRQHGYRVRTEPFHVRWSKDPVEDNLPHTPIQVRENAQLQLSVG